MAQKRALIQAKPSTLGDLLACVDGSGVHLTEDESMTIGEVIGRGNVGPRIVDVLQRFDLPLDSPLDVAEQALLDLRLADLLTPSDG